MEGQKNNIEIEVHSSRKNRTEGIKRVFAKTAFAAANVILRVMYPAKVTWEDKHATKSVLENSCVLYSNHTGHVDGIYMAELLKKYRVHTFVARDWYDKKKLNWMFRNLPYIPIDRKELDTSWLDLGVKKLTAGFPVYMFPEGKTSKTGEMDEFKPGFLMLAKRAKVPVVPICIDGSFKLFHRIHIIIGKPAKMNLDEEGRPSAVLKKYSSMCRDRVAGLKQEYGNI